MFFQSLNHRIQLQANMQQCCCPSTNSGAAGPPPVLCGALGLRVLTPYILSHSFLHTGAYNGACPGQAESPCNMITIIYNLRCIYTAYLLRLRTFTRYIYLCYTFGQPLTKCLPEWSGSMTRAAKSIAEISSSLFPFFLLPCTMISCGAW